VQQVETMPLGYMSCRTVPVWHTNARPHHVRDASRARHVAWRHATEAVLRTPSPCKQYRRCSTRAVDPCTRRRSPVITLRFSYHVTTCTLRSPRQPRRLGRPRAPVRTASRQVSRMARRSAHHPSVPHKRTPGSAHARTRASRRRSSSRSRGTLSSPARHHRVLTRSARAIHTTPPWFLTRISAAFTCPRPQGGWTRWSCTAWRWRPAWVSHEVTERASIPKAATPAAADSRGRSRHQARHRLGRRAPPRARSPYGRSEALAVLSPAEAWVLPQVDAKGALTGLPSGRAVQSRTAYCHGV